MTKLSTLEMTREQWLKARKQGIGSSDAGAILGLNQWRTPFQVWQEKTSPEIIEEPMTEEMEFGIEMEDVVAKRYMKRTGRKVIRDNKIRIHPVHKFMICNIDRIILPENGGGRGILEIKTTSGFAARAWETEIPLSYWSQIQHQLYVSGLEWGEFAVLADRHLTIFPVKRDDEYLKVQNKKLIAFWNENVLAKVAPEVTAADAVLLKAQTGSVIEATTAIVSEAESVRDLRKSISGLEKEKETHENIIKTFMLENEALSFEGKVLATWKQSKGSVTVDLKRLQTESPLVFEKYKVEKPPSRKFILKNLGENND